jgi:hypothetical protein
MKNFVNEFKSMDEALESRGFMLYGEYEQCFIAKYAENKYVVISMDYDSAQVWHVTRDITDAEFVSGMTGDYSEYNALYADSIIETLPLTWALGFDVNA